ncbi:hypothetical protein JGI7_00685 [Candidatus Kryptonium thompsonii]|jgi:hypothetical protein|uniref:Response regulatory domain-containing protein n=1 Tax=Candidatus Kryptonium thompsonii TaxID=1633631 RepID=A0A0P1LMS7_9BACT|nr:hypothetical protein [Candidatus Kryptonium thompsoni]CUS79239.1 hypothetical protein JGI10_00368 [Candidatus Kryptonium thompsoni]CUS82293.1 hypothetical protein JGI8_00589 [Candidatus Kryptonium thompsoni]CUS82937.1 hypothetical protein JGI6_00879 [Candidatus Kryptonium thompsoni]CUS83261.1 hypothetical protein JGI7_00685 [Candidatus Kryptonium thompsoni]CUS93196.1 hypothetical protein JGI15_10894 [Candidatus Kryptonium thompsoni]
MSIVCKILVYTSDLKFSERIKEIFAEKDYIVKTTELFTEVVEILYFELYDILVIEPGFIGDLSELLKLADNIFLGIPIVVACNENKLRIEDGNNSRFYFINKFANPEEWRNVIQIAVDENYIIKPKEV